MCVCVRVCVCVCVCVGEEGKSFPCSTTGKRRHDNTIIFINTGLPVGIASNFELPILLPLQLFGHQESHRKQGDG